MTGGSDPLDAAILAGALRALRKRAAWRRERGNNGVATNEEGVAIVSSDSRADLNIADDLEAIAVEIERASGQ